MFTEYKPRRRYDIEFKREAVRLATSPDRSIEGVARDLDIHPNMLHRFKKKFKKNQLDSFPGTGHQTPEQARIMKLVNLRRRQTRIITYQSRLIC